MGLWMDQQMKAGELHLPTSENEVSNESSVSASEEVNLTDYELHSEVNSEYSDAATVEQRRAYKLEIQVS